MKIDALPIVALTIFFFSGPARPAEYNLHKTSLKVGQTVSQDFIMSVDDATLSAVSAERSVKGTISRSNRRVEVVKITRVTDGQLSEFETEYKEYADKNATTINGQSKGDDKKAPLHGATVISRFVDGKWERLLKDGEPTEAQKKALQKGSFLGSGVIYEDRDIAVGESWAVPAEVVSVFMGDSGQGNLTGTMQCKFERIETVDGHPCAIVSAHLKATGKATDQLDLQVELELKGTIIRTLAEKIDLKIDLAGTIKMQGPVPNPPGAKVEVLGPMQMKCTSSLAQ